MLPHHDLQRYVVSGIGKLRDFYTEVTAFELIEHLHRCSGGCNTIDAVDIMSNMKKYFDKAASIPVYINMMETAP